MQKKKNCQLNRWTTVSNWPVYQKFLTHLINRLFFLHESKMFYAGQNGSFIRNVHFVQRSIYVECTGGTRDKMGVLLKTNLVFRLG